ncbi:MULTISPECIES: MMPL family transporter [unclassified Luteococcus]|uniref:MMPL family transporter n=1 Tax=unclassified Luteococcus TaxID=2639923 RepID=UPI00313B909B
MSTTTSPRRAQQPWVRRHLSSLLSLALLLVGLAVIGGLGTATSHRTGLDQLPEGSDSAALVKAQESLPDKDSSAAIVLFSSEQKLSGQAMGVIGKKAAELTGSPKAPMVPSQDGTAVFVPVTVDGVSAPELKGGVGDLRERAKQGLPDGVTAQVTGPAAIQTDLGAVFDGANVKLLTTTALVVAILLVVTYRSPWLWLVPLAVVGVADRLATVLATQALNRFNLAWDESTTGILSVLVFGAGTDYALLLISRYRDELRRHSSRHDAMRVAARRTVEPVVASASTVFVGLLTLLLSAFPATRGLGVACAVGVVVAAGFVLTVLPGALVAFGRWIFWPRKPVVGEASATESDSIWARVGHFVKGRPATVAIASTVLLTLAALGIGSIRLGLSDADQFLKKPEAIVAADRLARSYPAGSANPILVTTPTAQVGRVTAQLKGVDGVNSVRPSAAGAQVTELQVVTDDQPGSAAAEQRVRLVRDSVQGLPDTHVGGSEAQRVDKAEGNAHDRKLIFPVVLGLVFAALVLLLRSVVAPVILVGTVLLTYVAALGLGWWAFTGVLGFDRMDGQVPLYAFVFLVALGVDYNIFLVTRAREEAGEHGSRDGMLRALAATGGVITSAGILLASVFAVLGVLPLVVLAQLGVVIFIGVLLDTLVVRTVLVPALALLLGRTFWWPRKLPRG